MAVGTKRARGRHVGPGAEALYSVLTIERLRGMGTLPIGVILLDSKQDRLYLRLRDDLADVADKEALEVLDGLAEATMLRAAEEGATRLFESLLDSLSGYVRIGDPRPLKVSSNWTLAVSRLFEENVAGPREQPRS